MDQPPRRVKYQSADAWFRFYWIWDVYFGLGYVALLVLLLNETDATPGSRLVAISALTVMTSLYVFYARRRVIRTYARISPWRGRLFVAGVMLCLFVGVVAVPEMSFALFAACPMTFMALRLREAIVVVIPANLLPVLGSYFDGGIEALSWEFLPGSLMTVVFAVLLGTWIHHIVQQSEDRAVLIQELEESREEVERLSREAGMSAERARLAAEIHDTLAQGFTSLVTLVQAAESELDGDREKARRHLQLAARTARENLGEARALVAGLMPVAMGTGSLEEAVRRQLDRLAEETTVGTELRVEGESAVLPTGLEVILLRAVQESLTNVRKHSGASHVLVTLTVADGTARLSVRDNGGGFDPGRIPDTGFGLRGIRARAAQVGGGLTVHSGPEGTTLELEVPL